MSWKRSVASMKLTSGNRCFLLVKSVVILGAEFRSLRSRGHLSCAYLGQCSRKCSTVSLGWLHAGHLGLSTNLNLKRYWLSGTCPVRSWNSQLAAFRDISRIVFYDNEPQLPHLLFRNTSHTLTTLRISMLAILLLMLMVIDSISSSPLRFYMKLWEAPIFCVYF